MANASISAALEEHLVVNVTDLVEAERQKIRVAVGAAFAEILAARENAVADHGWTMPALNSLIGRLAVGSAADQARVIEAAMRNGGVVLRTDVYRIAGYPADRSLKGFSRPVNRIVQQMRESGEISATAIDPFVPIYDGDVKGYQKTKGFRVPAEIVALATPAPDRGLNVRAAAELP